MSNHKTRDKDMIFFRNIFSMMAYGEPDDFYGQISAIAWERFPSRIEIGLGPISEGYSPLGTVEVGPFSAGAILGVKQTNGLFEKVYGKLLKEEGNGIWKYMTNKEPLTSIRVDTSRRGISPFGIELKIERYLDVSRNYEGVDPSSDSLDDLQLEREAVMIWHVADLEREGALTLLPDRRI